MNFRRVARHLGVDPRSVANWVKSHTETLPAAPVPEKVGCIVDCENRCIFGWKIVGERTQALIQLIVDDAQKAKRYFNDAFHTDAALFGTLSL